MGYNIRSQSSQGRRSSLDRQSSPGLQNTQDEEEAGKAEGKGRGERQHRVAVSQPVLVHWSSMGARQVGMMAGAMADSGRRRGARTSAGSWVQVVAVQAVGTRGAITGSAVRGAQASLRGGLSWGKQGW